MRRESEMRNGVSPTNRYMLCFTFHFSVHDYGYLNMSRDIDSA